MDMTDYKILEILENQARISMRKLGHLVGLTPPAVTERVKRLEEIGIIEGYRTVINPQKLKKYIIAYISVDVLAIDYKRFLDFITKNKKIFECHHVIGGNCSILKVMVENMEELKTLIEDIKKLGNTKTSIVLSSPIKYKSILQKE